MNIAEREASEKTKTLDEEIKDLKLSLQVCEKKLLEKEKEIWKLDIFLIWKPTKKRKY